MDLIKDFDYCVITVETANGNTYNSMPIELNDANSEWFAKLLDNPTQFNFLRFSSSHDEQIILSELIIRSSVIKLKFINADELNLLDK